ncbi:hypothetical protein NPN18_26040, partial [Vibrio parahaemolyticus]|nr:hypothetical protein [Vibrio parahaemolyticus]
MEKKFNEIVQHQKDKAQVVQVQKIGSSNMKEIKANVDELTRDIFFFGFLEVEFRECMEPVRQLGDVEKLRLKCHQVM